MKRLWIRIIIILILASYGVGYVKNKQYNIENDVINYLKTDVKVKIKGDSNIYSYYKNKDGNVVLDSYIEDGEVNIVDKVMK